MPNKSELEDTFRFQLKAARLPNAMEQVRLIPKRRFKHDFFFEAPYNLAVEIQGGIWMKKGGHNTGQGIKKDCEKHTLTTLAGYWSMAFTGDHVLSGQALKWVQEFIEKVDKNAKT